MPRHAVLLALLALLVCSTLGAQPARYGIDADLKKFPQATPQEALGSVLKAVEQKRHDYLVAHLADPDFIDERIKKGFGGNFTEQVEDTRARLDPFAVRQLRRFLEKGKWAVKGDSALVRLPDGERHVVRLRKKDDRWFLQHASAPDKPKKAPK